MKATSISIIPPAASVRGVCLAPLFAALLTTFAPGADKDGVSLVLPEGVQSVELPALPTEEGEESETPPAAPEKARESESGPAHAKIGRREVKAHFVFFTQAGDQISGGIQPMTVRVEDNPTGEPAVGVMQEFAGGTGGQWNATLWMAALNATKANGQYVNDYEFLLKVGGYVDGPSAGMLTTVCMLAAIRGDELLPATTMTGTINPDGTCGPVGGIPQKMEGAAGAGFKRFGYPVGLRLSTDLATGEKVDVVDLAKKLGLKEVREIRTLEDAYEFFTGQKLESEPPLRESEMQVSTKYLTQYHEKAQVLKKKAAARAEVISGKLDSLPEELGEFLTPLLAQATRAVKAGDRLAESGLHAVEYMEFMKAEIALRFVELAIEFGVPAYADDVETVSTKLAKLSEVSKRVEAFAGKVDQLALKRTVGGRLNAMDSLAVFSQSVSHVETGAALKEQLAAGLKAMQEGKVPEDQLENHVDALLEVLTRTVYHYAVADVMIEYSEDLSAITEDEGPVSAENMAGMTNQGRAYASAAAAGLMYFDSLVVDPLAAQRGISAEQAQSMVANREQDYPAIRFATARSSSAGRLFNDPHLVALFQVGLGSSSYLSACELANKYYALAADFDEDGQLILGNRQLLTVQLEEAKKRALSAAAACRKKLGFVPVSAGTVFQAGVNYREGTDEEKLQALGYFWRCTLVCELAGLIAR